MKYVLALSVAALIFFGYRAAIDRQKSEEKATQGAVSLVDAARAKDGRIELAKIVESPVLPEERRAALREADLDDDGFLTDEEYENMPNLASVWREEALKNELAKSKEEQMRKMLFIAYSEAQGVYYNSAEAFNRAFRNAGAIFQQREKL